MRLTHAIALVSLITAACGTPCRDRKVAFIAAGGPIGILAAALDQCSDEPQPPPEPTPIAAVPIAGLSEQPTPDLGTPPDMAEPSPDLSPLSCGPLFVVSTDGSGAQFCDRDADGDAVADRLDGCPTLSAGQTPDPKRRGCPAPRTYTITLPPAAFSASGPLTVADGVVTSKAYYDWAGAKFASGAMSAVIFFEHAGASASNSVKFELQGVADFSAPTSTAEACKPWKGEREDATDPNPATKNDNDRVCVPRRVGLCIVDMVSKASQQIGEAECASGIQHGTGYRSTSNAPIALTASVSSADWLSSDPQPAASVEVQVTFSGKLKLSGWEVVAHVTETLK